MPSTRTSLLEGVRDLRNPRDWSEFDRVYRPLLAGYARRRGLGDDEAEEIAQQCMAVIVERIGTFNRRVSFRAWLRKMVDHKVSHHFSRRARVRRAGTTILNQAPGREPSPDDEWERQWNRTHLLYCLNALRDNFASHTLRAFEMYVLEGRPVVDICRELNITPNQVYVAKARVKQRLREQVARLWAPLYGGAP